MSPRPDESQPPVLRADRLFRFFHAGDDEILALQGVDLSVSPGEVVAVAGPSGSGKSTLLACLAGLDDPDGGTVLIEGARMSRQPEAVRSRLRRDVIGILYQSGNLLPHLSVTGNMEVTRRLTGTGGGKVISEVLDEVGIGHRAHAMPSTLSGGETARAGLAVAIVNNPRLLLADEPTGELDAGSEQRLLALLRRRSERGLAIIVASHSPVILDWADRVLHLEDGRPVDADIRVAS